MRQTVNDNASKAVVNTLFVYKQCCKKATTLKRIVWNVLLQHGGTGLHESSKVIVGVLCHVKVSTPGPDPRQLELPARPFWFRCGRCNDSACSGTGWKEHASKDIGWMSSSHDLGENTKVQ